MDFEQKYQRIELSLARIDVEIVAQHEAGEVHVRLCTSSSVGRDLQPVACRSGVGQLGESIRCGGASLGSAYSRKKLEMESMNESYTR